MSKLKIGLVVEFLAHKLKVPGSIPAAATLAFGSELRKKSGTLKEDSFPGKNPKCGLKQIVNSYSFKTAVKCENETPWEARTIDNKHAALSAEKSSDNPFVECNFDRKVCQEVAPMNFCLNFVKEIKQFLQ